MLSCLLSLSVTHELTSSALLLLNPITLTLPVFLVWLSPFQGPFVKASQQPGAPPCGEVIGPSRRLDSPLQVVWVGSVGRGGASMGQGASGPVRRPRPEEATQGRWNFCSPRIAVWTIFLTYPTRATGKAKTAVSIKDVASSS